MTSNQELRATADKMLELIERLTAAERQKRDHEEVGSPAFVALAEESLDLARLVDRWAAHQLDLARRAGALPTSDGVRLIDVEPRQIHRILADWREAQMRFDAAPPGSSEAAHAKADADRLRDEYREAELRLREQAC